MTSEIIDTKNPLWQENLNLLRHDVYHLPQYVQIEAVRNDSLAQAFLFIDGDRIFFLPYLVRSCASIAKLESDNPPIFDVISPYGYPSLLLSESAKLDPEFANNAFNELKKAWKARGICSAFIRLHPILSKGFEDIFAPGTLTDNGETISMDLTLSVEEIWAHTRRGHQSTINKCKRIGFTGRMVALETHIDEFMEVYQETMQRVSAKEFYYFDRHYLQELSKLGDALHLCLVEQSGKVASACLFFECDRIIQAHLGGTKNEFLSQSPFCFLLDYVRYWAKERGNEYFHIGGGVGSNKDSVHRFKAGFSRQKHNFLTLRAIVDRQKYDSLVNYRSRALNVSPEQLEAANFFPAYRAF